MVVVTIKKNNNMNTISGNEAVFTAGIPFFFFLNFDIRINFKNYSAEVGSASDII